MRCTELFSSYRHFFIVIYKYRVIPIMTEKLKQVILYINSLKNCHKIAIWSQMTYLVTNTVCFIQMNHGLTVIFWKNNNIVMKTALCILFCVKCYNILSGKTRCSSNPWYRVSLYLHLKNMKHQVHTTGANNWNYSGIKKKNI